MRIGMSVVHHDCGATKRICLRALAIGANVFRYDSVVEAVQVNALAVDFLELVARVGGVVDVPSRIDGHGCSLILDIYDIDGITDVDPGVALHLYACGVSDLDGIATDGIELVEREYARVLTGRLEIRMSPQRVTEDVTKRGFAHFEIRSAFFEQNSSA